MTTPRPLQRLQALSKQYPTAWQHGDTLRRQRGGQLPDWPAWCFAPMSGWQGVIEQQAGLAQLTPALMQHTGQLAALGAWRVSQGIYQFDHTLQAALVGTRTQGDLPADVLLRLPEWSLYVETPGLAWEGRALYGAWVHLEWDLLRERPELRYLLDTEGQLVPIALHLGPWSIEQALQRALNEGVASAQAQGIQLPDLLQIQHGITQTVAALQPLVALTLYLCSDEPEIDDRDYPGDSPGHPQPRRTKKGDRLFPPKKPRVWAVGEPTGAAIRVAEQARQQPSGDRSGPAPHIRRAHWHGFWRGPKAGERTFGYRWLPPIPVMPR